jgi:hypothetical protein
VSGSRTWQPGSRTGSGKPNEEAERARKPNGVGLWGLGSGGERPRFFPAAPVRAPRQRASAPLCRCPSGTRRASGAAERGQALGFGVGHAASVPVRQCAGDQAARLAPALRRKLLRSCVGQVQQKGIGGMRVR